MQEGRRMKTSLEKYSPLTLLQGFERVACERMLETERKLHILTPLLWPSRCVLFSWSWGPLHRGFPRAPSVGCGFSLPHLVSNSLGVCWQLHRGFPRSPSVGCDLPYHISSLTLWESAGNCIGGFPRSPSVGCGLPYHIWYLTLWESAGNCIGGFPSAPSVGCGLPYHISSLLSGIRLATASGVFRVPPRSGVAFPTTSGLYCLEFDWQLLWDPNSTELNNNSTPTRSPTGSLKSNV